MEKLNSIELLGRTFMAWVTKSDLPTDYAKQGTNKDATNTVILKKLDNSFSPTVPISIKRIWHQDDDSGRGVVPYTLVGCKTFKGKLYYKWESEETSTVIYTLPEGMFEGADTYEDNGKGGVEETGYAISAIEYAPNNTPLTDAQITEIWNKA